MSLSFKIRLRVLSQNTRESKCDKYKVVKSPKVKVGVKEWPGDPHILLVSL